jgi:hypothetical protein
MRLSFAAELSVDAPSFEDAWRIARAVQTELSAVTEKASLSLKMESVAVVEDEILTR